MDEISLYNKLSLPQCAVCKDHTEQIEINRYHGYCGKCWSIRQREVESRLNLCDKKHEEICYRGSNCPACEVRDQTQEEYQEEIDKLVKEISNLEEKIADHECQ